jgi:enterochelin esterase-like enzyme
VAAPEPVHGALVDVTYVSPLSTTPAGIHPLAVYTPPNYDPYRAVPYPTLYLSHGGGGNEVDWSTQGAASNIIDNLIAAGKIQPMVVVMTNFNGIVTPAGAVCIEDNYSLDVINSVIPYVEVHYNVSKNVHDRAFSGLSMGGRRANCILFNHTTAFGTYSIMSTAPDGYPYDTNDPRWENPELKALLGIQSASGIYDGIRVIDRGHLTTIEERRLLTEHIIPFVADDISGGHEWYVWRIFLRDFVTGMAFNHTTTSLSPVVAPGSSDQRAVNFLTATVQADMTEPARPTGKVQFYVDGQKAGPAMPLLPDGTAKVALPRLSPGSHIVTAEYSGDHFYSTSVTELTVTR